MRTLQQSYGSFAVVIMGRTESGLVAIGHAIVLDPLNARTHFRLGEAYRSARRYEQAVAAFNDVIALDPQSMRARAWRGFAFYGLGDLESARSSCEVQSEEGEGGWTWVCLASVYHKLARQSDAEAMLERLQQGFGDLPAIWFAGIYAQWGNPTKAREWLTTAVRLRDPGLFRLKTDPFLDPVRDEPWFKAVERELKFPN